MTSVSRTTRSSKASSLHSPSLEGQSSHQGLSPPLGGGTGGSSTHVRMCTRSVTSSSSGGGGEGGEGSSPPGANDLDRLPLTMATPRSSCISPCSSLGEGDDSRRAGRGERRGEEDQQPTQRRKGEKDEKRLASGGASRRSHGHHHHHSSSSTSAVSDNSSSSFVSSTHRGCKGSGEFDSILHRHSEDPSSAVAVVSRGGVKGEGPHHHHHHHHHHSRSHHSSQQEGLNQTASSLNKAVTPPVVTGIRAGLRSSARRHLYLGMMEKGNSGRGQGGEKETKGEGGGGGVYHRRDGDSSSVPRETPSHQPVVRSMVTRSSVSSTTSSFPPSPVCGGGRGPVATSSREKKKRERERGEEHDRSGAVGGERGCEQEGRGRSRREVEGHHHYASAGHHRKANGCGGAGGGEEKEKRQHLRPVLSFSPSSPVRRGGGGRGQGEEEIAEDEEKVYGAKW